MQKHVNLVDLVKSFPTNIYLQNLASIQRRTSPVKFAHLAEKSENGSISNLSTKVIARIQRASIRCRDARAGALDEKSRRREALEAAKLVAFCSENELEFDARRALENAPPEVGASGLGEN